MDNQELEGEEHDDDTPNELGGYNCGVGGRLRSIVEQPAYPVFNMIEADWHRYTNNLTEAEIKSIIHALWPLVFR